MPPASLTSKRRSANARSLLSVWHSIIVATEGGRIASSRSDSSAAPVAERPWPRAIAASMEALGTADFFAVEIARARRGFRSGFGPPTT